MAFLKALAKSELQPGQSRCVVLEGKRIGLFNVDGQYYALDDVCTHAEASLSEGFVEKTADGKCLVACPWHGALFDLKSGAALTLPAVRPVKTYKVRIEGEALEVEL